MPVTHSTAQHKGSEHNMGNAETRRTSKNDVRRSTATISQRPPWLQNLLLSGRSAVQLSSKAFHFQSTRVSDPRCHVLARRGAAASEAQAYRGAGSRLGKGLVAEGSSLQLHGPARRKPTHPQSGHTASHASASGGVLRARWNGMALYGNSRHAARATRQQCTWRRRRPARRQRPRPRMR